jgi:hypothetical protein
MLHLMRQALADTAAAGQDDRPSAGGDVDMVDQGAAAPDPQVPTGVSLSKAQNESLAKMTGERKRQLLQIKTADEMGKMQPDDSPRQMSVPTDAGHRNRRSKTTANPQGGVA